MPRSGLGMAIRVGAESGFLVASRSTVAPAPQGGDAVGAAEREMLRLAIRSGQRALDPERTAPPGARPARGDHLPSRRATRQAGTADRANHVEVRA